MAKYNLTLKIDDLRASIDDAYEEGTDENAEITSVFESISPNGEDIAVEVDTEDMTVTIQ